MKKTLLITGVLLALTATLASAEGVSLNWLGCHADGGSVNRDFACNTNGGTFGNNPAHDMYISVDPPPSVTQTSGHNHFVDLQSLSPTLPAWWDMNNTPSCRGNTLTGSGDFSTSGGLCADIWEGGGSGAIAGYNTNFNGVPNRVRVVGSIASQAAFAMNPGTEYYSMRIRILNFRTVGTGACAGCTDPVCLVLNLVRISQIPGTPGGDIDVTNPMNGARNYVTWQGGAVGGAGCPGSTPTKNATWGKVKSLYR